MDGGELREFVTYHLSEDSTPRARADAVSYLADYLCGAEAEDAVMRLVDSLDEEHLNELVGKYVMRWPPGIGSPYCRNANALAVHLTKRGFSVQGTSRWRVSWDGGTELEGEDLCVCALIAACWRLMRGPRPQLLPPY